MKKLLFVMNPNAGTRKANKLLTDILSIFSKEGFDVHIHITREQDDGRRVVAKRAKDMDLVVCCGGDGTFNETIAGLMDGGAKCPVGYIPAGSTNDFANSLGLPTDPLKAAAKIATGTPTAYDAGSFNGRYFTYVASFGAFTKTSYTTPQNIKNALGHTAYLLSGIQEISQIRAVHGKFTLDGEVIEDDFLFGAICNSNSLGGIVTLDPKQVDMRDGKFELLLVRAPKDLIELGECIQAVQKQVYNCKMITFLSASQIQIKIEPLSWSLDGEHQEGKEEILVENIHHAFKLVQ